MDQDKLDQIFRSELHDHTTALDKDSLWANIDQQQKRNTKFFALKLLSLIVAVAMVTIYFINSSSEITAEDPLAPVENYSIQPYSQAHLESSKKETNNTNLTKAKKAITQKAESIRAIKKINNTKTTSNTTTTNKTLATQTTTSSTANHSYTAPLLKNISETRTTPSANNKVFSSKDKSTVAPLQSSIAAIANKKNELSYAQRLGMQALSPLNYNRPPFSRNDKIECYDHRKKVHPFYLEVYSSVDFIKNWLSANGNEELSYLNERKATQTQLQGYRAGLRLKYLTRSGLYFKAGVEFGAIRERFDRSETTEKTEILPNQLLETITQADTTIYIYGDAPVTIVETTSWKVWNTYKTVGIPVLLGYQTELKKFNLGIELGAIYNVLYKFEGMLLDKTLVPTMDPDFFKNRINTSLTGGLSLGYKLNSRYTAMAYTSFKHNLSDINNQYNPITQSNSKIGIGIGLEIKL